MRIRCKKWAKPELEKSHFFEANPQEWKGKWHEKFVNNGPLHLELGCGKGSFIASLAASHPDINYIAIDAVDAMLGLAKRNVEQVYGEKELPIQNIWLTKHNIERIPLILDENDVIDRIYINFCNPWPKGQHRKRRLTHTRQLENYKTFLKDGGEIYFRTDDTMLFQDSLGYFERSGFTIVRKTEDLHSENAPDNILTEHEIMFSEQGIKIKALIAKWEKKDNNTRNS